MKHAGKRALAFILCLILCAGMLQIGALAAETLSITSIKANKTTASTGESITWTATATGGTGTLQYYFIVYKDGTKVKTRAYSTANTFSFTPTEAGTYKAKVYVKDAADTKVSKLGTAITVTAGAAITISSIKADKTSAGTGTKITWTATATGGTGTLQYYFIVYKDGTKVKSRAYSTANTFSYTPTEAGAYKAKVYVKDTAEAKVSKTSTAVTVTAAAAELTISSSKAEKTSANAGETITWTAKATGGTGTLQYYFIVYKDGTKVKSRAYSTANTFSYTPTEAGAYKAKVYVKDTAETKVNKTSTAVTVTAAAAELTISSIKADKTSANVGETITWTAKATGGTGTLQYYFIVYKDGTKVKTCAYSTKNTFAYTPEETGVYKVRVYVKDAADAKVNKLSKGVTVESLYDTRITTEIVPVDRGIGTYAFYLTGGKNRSGEAIADYAGDISGSVSRRSVNGATERYLSLRANFSNSFPDGYDSETGTWYYIYASNYKKIRVEITPFEGESFSSVPSVTASYWDSSKQENVNVSFSAALKNGKIILTAARPERDDLNTYTYTINVNITLNGVTQTVSIYLWCRSSISSGTATVYCDTWEETLAELAKGTQNVYYRGEEDVTLTSELTLNPDQRLQIGNANFTIGKGGVLTVAGDENNGASVNLNGQGKTFTVASGGILATNSQSENQNRYCWTIVYAYSGSIVVKKGGRINVPAGGYFELYANNGTIDLKSGSTVASENLLELYTSNGSITIGGKVTSSETLYVQGACVIAETGSVISSGYCQFSGQTQNYGKITHTGRNLNFNGRLENYGTIKITRSDSSSSYSSASNTGYTIVNAESGTIELGEGCTLSVNGTVLLNQGAIPGMGTLYIRNTESDSEYQNGIGRIEQDTSRNFGPDNYTRSAFTAEPASTMTVVTFCGKFVNEGSYAITVVDQNN